MVADAIGMLCWVLDDMLQATGLTLIQVYWLIGPYALFTLAFGGVMVPKLNLYVDPVVSRVSGPNHDAVS